MEQQRGERPAGNEDDLVRTCPYCHQAMTWVPPVPDLPVRQKRIYDAVSAAGPEGVKKEDLLQCMFANKTPTKSGMGMMRVQIHSLNLAIAPLGQRVKSRNMLGTYFLINREH